MSPDLINGVMQAGLGAAVLNHCWTLYIDKEVRGVSAVSTALFTLYGIWTLYFYPYLGQFWSFAGGLFITVANALYVGMLIAYSRHPAAQWIKRNMVCRFLGHRNDAPYFQPSHRLYPCVRCGDELFGRSLDHLRTMPPLEQDDLDEVRLSIMADAEGRS
jgi:hypothetical protein